MPPLDTGAAGKDDWITAPAPSSASAVKDDWITAPHPAEVAAKPEGAVRPIVGAALNAAAQGAVSGTGAVVAGVGRGVMANAAKGTRDQLAVMDAIDQGKEVPQDQDSIGYQSLSADQRAKARSDFIAADADMAKREPNAVVRGGMALEKAAPGMFPVDPGQEGYITGAARLVGGMAPALVATAAGGALGGPVGGVLAGAAAIGAQTFDGTYQEAVAKGSSHEQAEDAAGKAAMGQIVAMSLPIGKVIPLIPLTLREGFVKTLVNLGQQGVEIGAGNAIGTMAQNYVAAHTYDPDRPLTQGVASAGLEGTVAGLVIRGAGAVRTAAAKETPTVADIGKAPTVDAAIEAAAAVAKAPTDYSLGPISGAIAADEAAASRVRVDAPVEASVAEGGVVPSFVPPSAPGQSLPRIMQLLNEDNRVAANRPTEIPPGSSIAQPAIPKTWGDIFAAKPADDAPASDIPPEVAATIASSVPQSVGAAASREGTLDTTFGRSTREIKGAQADMEMADLMKTPQPNDARDIIPGATQTKAEIELTPSASREAKGLRQEFREGFNDHEKANNEIYHRWIDDIAPPREQTATMMDLREANWKAAEKTVFGPDRDGAPVTTQPIVQHLTEFFSDPIEKHNSYAKKNLQPFLDALTDRNGAPIQIGAKELYGIRQEMGRKVKDMATDTDLAHLRGEFSDLMKVTDETITTGAPDYRAMMDDYRQASIPINAAQRLQDIKTKITNGSDRVITFGQMDRYMKSLWMERNGPNPYAPAKDINPATWDHLMLLHERLARSASADELARTKGSDTTQLMMEMMRKGALGIAHAGAAHFTGGLGNIAIPYITKQIDHSRALKKVGQHLEPDLSQYPPVVP